MPNPAYSEFIWILDRLISLGRVLIWPAFLWFFTKRPDVREHIQQLLTRNVSVQVPGARIRITSPEAPKKLPNEERERELPGPPRPTLKPRLAPRKD